MRHRQPLPFLLLPLLSVCVSVSAQDYIITVDGTATEIGLDEPATLRLPDGRTLELELRQKEHVRFSSDMFSFEHRSEYKAARTNLDEGIRQTTIITALGTGVLLQEYEGLNPSTLIDLMLSELTKEEVEYGYEYSESAAERAVDGVQFAGKRAITTSTTEEWTREVLAYGAKDRGLLIVTFIEKESDGSERQLIEQLWQTLELDIE